MKVLHLTAHLGGGVGKALSGLVAETCRAGSDARHSVVCFEQPQKLQFVDRMRENVDDIVICPEVETLERLMSDTDIVQLEFWNHPATIRYLCSISCSPIRLLTWSHISGLYTPVIPVGLILASHKFLFTSPCSLESSAIQSLMPALKDRLGVVHSCGGFSGLPVAGHGKNQSISAGYIGSMNFAKLHPHYVEYLSAVKIPGFRVRMIGDLTNCDVLSQQAEAAGRPGLFEFRGYSPDIVRELASINVLAYLLNPQHYGTTENALLEAMAMGIVPIVLDNPAERFIVEDKISGVIVRSPEEFAEAIEWLSNAPEERQRLGKRASESVRERFSVERMHALMNAHYLTMLDWDKERIIFTDIFGSSPSEWFLSCQREKSVFMENGQIDLQGKAPAYGWFERTKGTVFHFCEYFPEDWRLKQWAENLELVRPG